MSAPTPQELVERGLAGAGGEAVVLVTTTSTANLRWARNTLTTNGETLTTEVSVVVVDDSGDGPSAGGASRSGVTLDALGPLLAQAHEAARGAGPSPDARPLVGGSATDPDWTEEPALTTSAAFDQVAGPLGEVFRASQADGIEHFGYAEHLLTTTYLGTSSGLRRRHVQPQQRLELTAKSHARTRSAWFGTGTLRAEDVAAADAQLRTRLGWQARRVDVAPGRHPAVLTSSAVSDLMIDLYWTAVGRDAAEGRSVFSAPGGGTRVGERIGATSVSLRSDPGLAGLSCAGFVAAPASSSSTSVFDNGLALGPTAWIEDGTLRHLVTTRAGAEELGLPLAPAIDNLRLDVRGGSGTLEELVARTERGLLVNCLWYNRVVDPQTLLLTGLTRDGVYLVEGGEVVGATTNFRFNDSPVALLDRILDAGATERTLAREMGDYFNRAAMPPLLVADYNFSTTSQAS